MEVEATAPRDWREDVLAARSAAQALYSCAGSRRNRMMMLKAGVMPLLARLIQSDKAQLLIPIVGILNHVAKEVRPQNCCQVMLMMHVTHAHNRIFVFAL